MQIRPLEIVARRIVRNVREEGRENARSPKSLPKKRLPVSKAFAYCRTGIESVLNVGKYYRSMHFTSTTPEHLVVLAGANSAVVYGSNNTARVEEITYSRHAVIGPKKTEIDCANKIGSIARTMPTNADWEKLGAGRVRKNYPTLLLSRKSPR